MHPYNYRSVKALSLHRYPYNQNPRRYESVADDNRQRVMHNPAPARRKRRANDRAPSRSRAA